MSPTLMSWRVCQSSCLAKTAQRRGALPSTLLSKVGVKARASGVVGRVSIRRQARWYQSAVRLVARTVDGDILDRPGSIPNPAESLAKPPPEAPLIEVTKEPESPDPSPPVTWQQLADKIAPVKRFREYRPLTVSDLVSPMWCELQYFNSLSKYGKIKRSAQMKRGGEVHKKLELEVHEFVPVDIQTREDGWGLRLWNIIQGLRTLRVTGMTRELDVWGIVNGQVISGVIDEVSYTCPDPELEIALLASAEEAKTGKKDPDQMSIEEFFAKRKSREDKLTEAGPRVYVIDTKTRAYPSLPSAASSRAVKMQLMLYRFLITQLCTDKVSGTAIFSRYGVDANVTFSETFLKQIAELEFNFSQQASSAEAALSSQASTFSELREHANLSTLWDLVIREYKTTFTPAMLSPVLTAVFRTQSMGAYIGQRTFVHDDAELEKHVVDELAWWAGQRAPRGVDIEDAFKCRMCEFAEGCDWRKDREKEAMEMAKAKRGRPKKRKSDETSP
ncbi:hypothetical protein BT63DRAFT_423132 [Microthyrium microscopicum]|uniref:Exonuclease V n=1 Tax=Microthyrium microscopicum TaxID=703497 RepID=A0A6A6UIE2_9PEZI|nr:hypothetical protein BT63DRAFT_423132 [Microthyrium microscopicum]